MTSSELPASHRRGAATAATSAGARRLAEPTTAPRADCPPTTRGSGRISSLPNWAGTSNSSARIGWTCRDAWWALTQDPRVWATVPRAGAVVLRASAAWTRCRRRCRPPCAKVCGTCGRPRCAASSAPRTGGFSPGCPARAGRSRCRRAQRRIPRELRERWRTAPRLPVIGTLPSVHRSEALRQGPPRPAPARCARSPAWAIAEDVPLVDLGRRSATTSIPATRNPDGIHWGWEAHRRVAAAVVDAVRMAHRDAQPAADGLR